MTLTQAERRELIERARAVRRHAYAPYSSYPVGAAVLTGSGAIYDGANVENAVFPSGMCAERTAVFSAVSHGERRIVAVAVVTENGGSPCGGCRQVLWEFGPEAHVIIADAEGRTVREAPLAEFLPDAFGRDDLPARG